MKEKIINENNEKLIAQAEENAEAVEMAEVNEETAEENNEISLASASDTPTEEEEQTPKVSGDIEAYNFFGGNEHISPVNGSLTYKKTLFTMKGVGGFDLPITISYNSESSHRNYFEGDYPYKIAEGWYFCFDGFGYFKEFYMESSEYYMFKFANGSSYLFDNNSDDTEEMKDRQRYPKKDVEITASQVKYLNGVTETFYDHGGIDTITDRFGNGYKFTYGTNNQLAKIEALSDSSDCVIFEWIPATETESKKLMVSYGGYSVIFEFRQETTTWMVDLVSSITDIDGLKTSFDYDIQNASYTYRVQTPDPDIDEFNFDICAYYHLVNKIIYPTGGCRKYTYTSEPSESFPVYERYFVQKAELCESDAENAPVVDTFTYSYQKYYENAPVEFMTDFNGNAICGFDATDYDNDDVRTSVIDNGKTVTKFAFTEKGIKLAEEVYIKGNTIPYSKTIYTNDETNDLPTNIKTGLFNGTEWNVTEESFVYIPYYDIVTRKTDKMGRTTHYEYSYTDETEETVANYGLPESEAYENVTKTYTLSSDKKKVKSVLVSYGDKSVLTNYTYGSATPCNVTNETVTVTDANNIVQQISKINYTYTENKKFIATKTVANVNSNLPDLPYSYNTLVTSYTYDMFGRVISETDPEGNVTSYLYAPSGKLARKTTADGSVYENTYPNPEDGNIYTSKATYDGISMPVIKEYPCDNFGRILSEKNRINSVDSAENLYYTVNSYEYTDKNLTKVTSGFGSYTVYTYDAFDRVVSQKVYNSAGTLQNEKSVIYDDFNRIKTTVSDTLFEKVYLDEVGRKTTVESGYIKTENDVEIYEVTLTTLYTYDNFDRVLTTTVIGNSPRLTGVEEPERRELITANTYSSDGNLLSVTDPMGNRTEYTYNLWNKIATVKYPNNAVYTYTYDTIGRLTKETDPNGKTVTTQYFPNSTVMYKTDKMGNAFSYVHDCMNRVAYDIDPDSNMIAGYTYVGTGALKTLADNTGTTTYSYDINGRLITKTTPQGTMSFTYYDNGLVKLIRDYNGARITHYYDDFGRLTKITRTTYGENATSSTPVIYTYNNFGQLSKAQYPKGKIEYTYDNRHRLIKESFYTGVRNSSVEPTNVKNIIYSYDSFGNIISRTTTKPDANNSESIEVLNNETFEYDNLFRLKVYLSFPLNEIYTYDCMGNRILKEYIDNVENTSGNVVYTYNNINQLLTEIRTHNYDESYNYSYTYTYDDNGNMLNDPKTGNTITYDYFRNKPITITTNDGTITYTYNGKGELIERRRDHNIGCDINRYKWDENGFMINEELYCSVGETTEFTNHYGNLVGLNGVFVRYNGDEETYLMKNNHGDVIYTQYELTILDNYDYDAFGNQLSNDPVDGNPFRYCGEYFDVHSGTYYLRNRFYNPRFGRFTTIDPIKDGHNWYVYCDNNPIMFIDSIGLSKENVDKFSQTMIKETFIGQFFQYDSIQDIYYAPRNCVQRLAGYNNVYDAVADVIMNIDKRVVYFNYGGKDWRIEFWKGDYGLFMGGEVGIYTKSEDFEIEHYSAASGKDLLYMKLDVYHKDDLIVHRIYNDYWWANGFKYDNGQDIKPEDMRVEAYITFDNEEQMFAFIDAYNSSGTEEDLCPTGCFSVSIIF